LEQSTNIKFTVDDCTGVIEVTQFLNNNTPQTSWREGMYMKASGHLKLFQNDRSLTSVWIQPLNDFNEITYHLLDAIHSHLVHTKGPSFQSTDFYPNTTSTTVIDDNSTSAYSFTQFDKNVLECIKAVHTTHPSGITVAQIARKLQCHESQIRAAFDKLSHEGLIYTTGDENHYLASES